LSFSNTKLREKRLNLNHNHHYPRRTSLFATAWDFAAQPIATTNRHNQWAPSRRAPMHTNRCKQENQRDDTGGAIIPARKYWCGKLLLTQFFAALLFNFTEN
jgi:hypothetical protein